MRNAGDGFDAAQGFVARQPMQRAGVDEAGDERGGEGGKDNNVRGLGQVFPEAGEGDEREDGSDCRDDPEAQPQLLELAAPTGAIDLALKGAVYKRGAALGGRSLAHAANLTWRLGRGRAEYVK